MYGCWLRCAGALRQLSGHTFVAWHGAGAVLGIAQSGSGAPPVHSPYHWHTVHWCWSTGHLLMSEYVKTIIIDSVIIVTERKWWFDTLIHLMVNNEPCELNLLLVFTPVCLFMDVIYELTWFVTFQVKVLLRRLWRLPLANVIVYFSAYVWNKERQKIKFNEIRVEDGDCFNFKK